MIENDKNSRDPRKIDARNFDYSSTHSMSYSHLVWLLPKIFEERVLQRSTIDILRQYRESQLVQPSEVSQRDLLNIDSIFYNSLPFGFCGIELSPVNPLGLNNVLAHINQKNILSTIKTAEVVADPTTALALECARRRSMLLTRNSTDVTPVKLCTSHRSLRLQSFENIPGFTTHFRCFALCTAGRNEKFFNFKIQNIKEHISFYLTGLQKLKDSGINIEEIIVSISDIRIMEKLITYHKPERLDIIKHTQDPTFDVFKKYGISLPNYIDDPTLLLPSLVEKYDLKENIQFLSRVKEHLYTILKKEYINISFDFDLHRIAGIRYYDDICFKISANNFLGNRYPLADGGMSSWNKKLLHDNKELLLSSGFGNELFYRMFARVSKNIL